MVGILNEDYILNQADEGLFGSPPNAYHTMEGIFGAYGDNIKQGFNRDAEIIDIAPTVLNLLDLPIPDYMEGEVLKDIEKDSKDVKEGEKLEGLDL